MTDTRNTISWQIPLLLMLWMIVFSPILPSMVDAWLSHSDNSHALLVPLVSLYFIWDKRAEVRRTPAQGSAVGLILLLLCLLIYLVSFIGGIAFSARMMFVASLIAILWAFLGPSIIRTLIFPLCFLFFMVPVPFTLLGMVSFPLQLMATKISAEIIQFFGIPVFREGNMLYFQQTHLEVAEACSGIRSIMALTMISAVFSYLSSGSAWRNSVLVFAAVPFAMIANIMRITGTGILAHFFGASVARGFLHDFSGIVVFIFGLIMLMGLYALLKQIGEKMVSE